MQKTIVIAALSAALGLAATGLARADCESDMLQLEAAYKTPNLKPDGKAALDKAKDAATSAMHKDDDETCHKAVGEALGKVGLTLK